MIFELARSEMGYTDQRPAEYAACVLGAAIAEGYQGPVFIQGDHFQISAKKYASKPRSEVKAVRDSSGGHRRRVLQHRHRHLDSGRPEQADDPRAAGSQLRAVRRIDRPCTIAGAEGRRRLRRRRDRRSGRPQQHRARTAGLHGRLQPVAGQLDPQGRRPVQDQHPDRHVPWRGRPTRRHDRQGQGGLRDPQPAVEDRAKQYAMGGAVQHGASTLPEEAFSKFSEAGARRSASGHELPEHAVRPPAGRAAAARSTPS